MQLYMLQGFLTTAALMRPSSDHVNIAIPESSPADSWFEVVDMALTRAFGYCWLRTWVMTIAMQLRAIHGVLIL